VIADRFDRERQPSVTPNPRAFQLEPVRHRSEARQREITEHVVAQGSSSPQELASMFHVSLMTIHRDLDALKTAILAGRVELQR